jgi:outer membrane protein assembly factor BamB
MNSTQSEVAQTPAPPKPKGVRLWPAFLIFLLSAAALAIVWMKPTRQRQDQVIRTFFVCFGTAVLLLLWVLILSRLPARKRLLVLLGVLACIVVGAGMFQIRGVTGDLRPIVEFRWRPKSSAPVTHGAAALTQQSSNTKPPRGNFPQFMGPRRNGILEGPAFEPDWSVHPPRQLWRHPVNGAWSGFASSGQFAITQEQRGETESVVCYDLLNGAELWSHQDQGHYSTTIAGEGPRGTPTISSNRVVTLGASGMLNVLDLETGRQIWNTNVLQSNGAGLPDWGLANSPLLIEDKIIVAAGGPNNSALVAYSLTDGQKLWAAGSGSPDYSSPFVADLLGTRQIIAFQESIRGCSPDGKILWEYPWPGGHPHISLPVQIGRDELLVSSGYGTGAALLKFGQTETGKTSIKQIWKSIALKSKFGPLLVFQDHVYGLDDGIFTCIDLKTGHRNWKDGRYGHGQGLLVKDLILLTAESGDIVLIRPNPEKLDEVARLKVFSDKMWNPPALAGQYLLVRNNREAACFELAVRDIL